MSANSGFAHKQLSRLVAGFTHGNGLEVAQTYTQDYELGSCTLQDGLTTVDSRSYARSDLLNLTGITDNVTAGNSATFGYSAANRLNQSTGPWVSAVTRRDSGLQVIAASTTT